MGGWAKTDKNVTDVTTSSKTDESSATAFIAILTSFLPLGICGSSSGLIGEIGC
jgi:hypothetical protein